MSTTNLPWVDSLPPSLKDSIVSLVQRDGTAAPVLDQLYQHFQADGSHKRQKLDDSTSGTTTDGNDGVKYLTASNLSILNKLNDDEIIFEIPSISFQSPLRKKLNLILHLIPENGAKPILSIVHPTTLIPEVSITSLSSSIKYCVLLPILGMSTVDTKKNLASLCFWLDEPAWIDGKNDPIICQVNFDLLKKHLIKTGKIPSNIESQFNEPPDNKGIKLIHEAIILFLQKQFQLCGINLINYLPSNSGHKNSFNINTDNAIALSTKNNTINDMLLIEAYKGAKDGSILLTNKNEFNPSYFIFGFKKPILMFPMDEIDNISYSEITRSTFSIIVKFKHEKPLEFSMIDQKYHQLLDEFLKLQGINDNSYDETLKEKTSDKKAPTTTTEASEGAGVLPGPNGGEGDDDEDEDDDNYQGGEEEDDDDDVAEEYDSNVEDSGSEGEDEDGKQDVQDDEPGNNSMQQ